MEGLNIEPYDGQDFLYYVGCEGAYDTRAQLAARAVATILLKAGISFGVLGNDEACDGNEVEMLGEDGLTELVAEKNIKNFQKLGVKKIITLSPHSYNALKNIYPRFGGEFEVFHYTQALQNLLDRIKPESPLPAGTKVTYHDPCFLGRWNSEYEAPRIVLKATGLQLVEMPRNKKGALCCGGGGGNFVTDFLGGSEESPARIRVREAHATGANLLAVACPNCLTMLEDAVKVEGLEAEITVKDIAEMFVESE